MRGGLYAVSAQINGAIKIEFLVDSGATTVVIPVDVFLTLRRTGTITPSDILGMATSVLADGSTREDTKVRLREIRIGTRSIKDVQALVIPVRGDPLLGQNVLSKFGSVTFDNQRRVLVLADVPPPIAPSAPQTSSNAASVQASGFGAIAYDEATGRFGASWNEPTPARANELALRQCAGGDCRVYTVEPKGCGALALSEKDQDGRVHWGGADRATLERAKADAVAHCRTQITTGTCTVRLSGCNQ